MAFQLQFLSKYQPESMQTALIVEDDALQRDIIRIALEGALYVLEAENAAKALELCREYPGEINVLICDFSLPGMNAAQLIPLAKQLRPFLKVLVISGHGEQYLRDAGIPENHSVLTKPFELAHIRQKVQSM